MAMNRMKVMAEIIEATVGSVHNLFDEYPDDAKRFEKEATLAINIGHAIIGDEVKISDNEMALIKHQVRRKMALFQALSIAEASVAGFQGAANEAAEELRDQAPQSHIYADLASDRRFTTALYGEALLIALQRIGWQLIQVDPRAGEGKAS